MIDLDAWLRAILASIYALLVAGERIPRDNQICAGNEWRDLNREQPLLGIALSVHGGTHPDQTSGPKKTKPGPSPVDPPSERFPNILLRLG